MIYNFINKFENPSKTCTKIRKTFINRLGTGPGRFKAAANALIGAFFAEQSFSNFRRNRGPWKTLVYVKALLW